MEGMDMEPDMDSTKEPEMQAAYREAGEGEATILMSGREGLQNAVFAEMLELGAAGIDESGRVVYNKNVRKNSLLDIVIGLPASGKSSAIVNTISSEFHSRVIDNDEVKKRLPEYRGGWGADRVHKESQKIADK